MGDTLDRWEDVETFACTLPDTQVSTSYRQPAVKVRGRMFVSAGHEPGSFHVVSPHEEKAVLLDTDADAFWQTPHYEGWPGLLVRYGAADADRVRTVIARGWWDRAGKRQREAFGDRP